MEHQISKIRLQQFRSYKEVVFEFNEGVNVIVGPNGSGKTNLLEAILLLARGSSYRAADTDLIQYGAEWTRLDAVIGEKTRTVKIQKRGEIAQKRYEIEEKPYLRLTTDKYIPVVLFEPNHLFMLQGPPEGRRNYLDDLLEQTKPGFTGFRKHYRRTLAQRNALLKRHDAAKQDFFPWNIRLSELGAVLHRARAELVAGAAEHITTLYNTISGDKTPISLRYEGRFPAGSYETHLLHTLEQKLPDDIARGFTAYGPHREDLEVLFSGTPAILRASRGELRTVTLALKILELQFLQHATGVPPLLLLDDVFSELDSSRRRALTTYLQRYQTFLTTTDADVAITHFPSSKVLPVVSTKIK